MHLPPPPSLLLTLWNIAPIVVVHAQEGKVSPVRLVHDERDTGRVAGLRRRLYVEASALVRRRHQQHRGDLSQRPRKSINQATRTTRWQAN